MRTSSVDEHLTQHPIVLLHPHPYQIASKAGYAPAELYQAIGNVVPDEEPSTELLAPDPG